MPDGSGDTRTRWVGRAGLGLLAVLLLAVACGSDADPRLLQGRYTSPGGSNRLELTADRWTLESGPRVKSGLYEVRGQRIYFLFTEGNNPAFRDFCLEEVETYTWSLDGAELTFVAVDDPCDLQARAVLTGGPWTRER